MAGQAGPPPRVDADGLRQLAALAGLEIAPGHVPGVIAALDMLLRQGTLLSAPPLDPLVEPAPVFRP